MQKCKAQHNMVARRLGGWVAGRLGGWAAGAPPPPLPPTDRNPPNASLHNIDFVHL